MKIGIPGTAGSFSEQAALQYIQTTQHKDVEIVFLLSFDQTFTSLSSHEIDLAVVPVYNSTMGLVRPAMEELAKHKCGIVDFFDMDITQCLLAQHGTTKDMITTIVSQQPALNQCPQYLQTEFPNAQIIQYVDTAQAAHDVAQGKFGKNAAAIASSRCASLYNLATVDEGIQDLKKNVTSFLVVRAE